MERIRTSGFCLNICATEFVIASTVGTRQLKIVEVSNASEFFKIVKTIRFVFLNLLSFVFQTATKR